MPFSAFDAFCDICAFCAFCACEIFSQKKKNCLNNLIYITTDGLTCLTSQKSFPAIFHVFLTYKCTRKPLLGNLFVVDRAFFGQLRPEDIQYCHSWKLKTAGSWNCWNLYKFFWLYHWYIFSVLQCIVLTNIVSSVRVSLNEKYKCNILKESIDFRVRTKW